MELEGKTCIVTGGAGFIGSHLVDHLLEQNASVRVIDNLINGHVDNLGDALKTSRCEIVELDIGKASEEDKVFAGVDFVLHLACLGVRHSIVSPLENHRVNALGTLNLLQICRSKGIKRILHCSSSEIYGSATTVPMKETHPARPHTIYGASKLAGEAYARAYHDCYGLDVTVVRPFNTYGPRSHFEGDAGEVIPKFSIRAMGGKELQIFGDGSNSRDFTYVEDMAVAMGLALASDELIGQTVNIGSGDDISLNELAETIIPLCGNCSATVGYTDARPGDVQRLQADVSLFESLTGWKPEVSLQEGLRRTVEYFRNHPAGIDQMLSKETGRNWE
ncbi:MAG: GDP-mannose 4,6-dehydratase [Candidatus Lindowbacteria bacterium]|nr:GDP-mannose 4,6-dehydratase [Candidatus Lindowbacteria bacterium]